MSYDIYFSGSFACSPPLSDEHVKILTAALEEDCQSPRPVWEVFGPGEIGPDEECSKGRCHLAQLAWLRRIITDFLAPWGHTLGGTVEWEYNGERINVGRITVTDNVITTENGRLVYDPPEVYAPPADDADC